MFKQNFSKDNSQWLPFADMMAGMMALFMTIALFYIQDSQQLLQEKETLLEEIQQAKQVYEENKTNLATSLSENLHPFLNQWNATWVDSTLTIQFSADENIAFEQGKDKLSPEFQQILLEFFPEYIQVLQNSQTFPWVQELRIEGHTSSEGNYFNNMTLSQARANAVLKYLLEEINLSEHTKYWLQENVSSNGMGARFPILKSGKEDAVQSRRVAFKLQISYTSLRSSPELSNSNLYY